MTEYKDRVNESAKSKGVSRQTTLTSNDTKDEISKELEQLQQRFRVFFPSHDTVANSKGGVGVRWIPTLILMVTC